MVKNILEFYTDILEGLGLKVDDLGNIFLPSRKGDKPFTMDGLSLVLPTDAHLKTIIKVENGKPELTKLLFNPLDESGIKGENKSLLKIKRYIENKVSFSVGILGEVILNILGNENAEIANTDFLMLVDEIKNYDAHGIKKIVDEQSVKNWVSILENGLKQNLDLFTHIYLKRGGKIGDEKYTRIANISFPVYEKLNKHISKESLYGVKIRNKDVHVFKKILEFTFELNEEQMLNGVQIGSKNLISPATVTLLTSYNWLANHVNKSIDVVGSTNIDKDYLEEARLNIIPFTQEELEEFISKIKYEIKEIPTEAELLIVKPNSMETQHVEQQPMQPMQQQMFTGQPMQQQMFTGQPIQQQMNMQQMQQPVQQQMNMQQPQPMQNQLSLSDTFAMLNQKSIMDAQQRQMQQGMYNNMYTSQQTMNYQPPMNSFNGNLL